MAEVEPPENEISSRPNRKKAARSKKLTVSPPRRDIPGNLPYLTAPGTLKRVADKIIDAQRPERFTLDFVESVLKITGGGARATLPILKRIGFLSSDGTPTELYAKFKTEGGRGAAALQGLKNGYTEIFKRNEYAHAADDNKLEDIIIEITGLQRGDQVVRAIKGTFNVFRSYIPKNLELPSSKAHEVETLEEQRQKIDRRAVAGHEHAKGISLAYNINLVLPETSDLTVLNAIFRSLKENLLA